MAAWYAGSAFVLILLATAFLYWILATDFDREGNQFLADQIRVLRALLLDHAASATSLEQEAEWESAVRQGKQAFVRVLDQRGHVFVETPGMSAELPGSLFPAPIAADEEPKAATEIRSTGGKPYRVASAAAVSDRSRPAPRIIQVALDRSQEEVLLADYRRRLWLVLGAALALCTAAGYLFARRGLRPLDEIISAAGKVHSATLHERLATGGLPAELLTLASTFNEMLDRLEASFARLSRFSADLAHELRTPVNNLRGEAEVALGKPRSPEEYREVLGSCLEETVRLSAMIDSLLFLARAEHPETQIVRQRLDVQQELQAVKEFFEASASEAAVEIIVAPGAPMYAAVDRPLFQRAACNLVQNALHHTPPGGRIALQAMETGEGVRVDVSDTGSGIAAEHLSHLFDRFYRADGARLSAGGRVGLGLAIVKGVMELHRGRASVASEPGRGTRVSLFFPDNGAASEENVPG